MRKLITGLGCALLFAACGQDTTNVEGLNTYTTYCVSCHAKGAVGGIGPNITFSTTAGIGGRYTQANMLTLIRTGAKPDGVVTCDTMTRFSATVLPDAKVQTLYTYLQSLKNDTVNKGSSCPHP
jgi:cytochrome c553